MEPATQLSAENLRNTEREPMNEVDSEISLYIRARFPLLSVVTYEEFRFLRQLSAIRDDIRLRTGQAETAFQILRWTAVEGLVHWSRYNEHGQHEPMPVQLPKLQGLPEAMDPTNPVQVMRYLCFGLNNSAGGVQLSNAIYVFCDLHAWLDREDRAHRFNHLLVRAMRDLYQLFRALDTAPGAIIMLSPRPVVPVELAKEIQIIDYPLPTFTELKGHFERVKQQLQADTQQPDCVRLTPAEEDQLLMSLRGLTYDEADSVVNKSVAKKGHLDVQDIDFILREKEQIIKKDGTLEYFHSQEGLTDVGGLELLQRWLERRRSAFQGGKLEYRGRSLPLPVPRGILLIGVPGAGKSLLAKAVARSWQLPLLRLDIGRVFGSVLGQSEENMRRALRIAESVSPCILWLDEVEKAFPRTTGASDAGTSMRVMATFLTWLQEKESPVFLVATGNDIDQIPIELTRKGRFDEIFYVGLPDLEARRTILQIHTREYPLPDADLDMLARTSRRFTGAEIGQAIKNAIHILPEFVKSDDGHTPKTSESTPLALAVREAMSSLVPLADQRIDGRSPLAATLDRARMIAIPAAQNFEPLEAEAQPAVTARRAWFREGIRRILGN